MNINNLLSIIFGNAIGLPTNNENENDNSRALKYELSYRNLSIIDSTQQTKNDKSLK